jgi:hypothetical protein
MRKYLIAAALIVSFTVPALAADYYVALRYGGGGCVVMTTSPNPKAYKLMGIYPTMHRAKMAMHGMMGCQ